LDSASRCRAAATSVAARSSQAIASFKRVIERVCARLSRVEFGYWNARKLRMFDFIVDRSQSFDHARVSGRRIEVAKIILSRASAETLTIRKKIAEKRQKTGRIS
jgi:hypothetical protein